MYRVALLSAALLALSRTALGDGFTVPSNGDDNALRDYSKNPIYHIGSTINVQWDSDLDKITLVLWQNDNANLETVVGNVNNKGSYAWKVNTTKDYHSKTGSNGQVFFLSIFEPGKTSPAYNSRYFNLTDPIATTAASYLRPSSTSTSSSPSSTSGTAANAPATITSAGAAVAAADTSSSSSSNNSVALGAGLGVGLGLPLLAAIGALVWFLRRRKQHEVDKSVGIVTQNQPMQGDPSGAGGAFSPGYKAAGPTEAAAAGMAGAGGYYQPPEKGPLLHEQTQRHGPAEMMGSNVPGPMFEMDGTPVPGTGQQAPNVDTGVGDVSGRSMHEMPGARS